MSDYYKVMDRTNNREQVKTLFPEVGPQGPLTINRREVVDRGLLVGARGWHVFDTLLDALEHLRTFKGLDNKVIVRCKISGEVSRRGRGLVLAEQIYICQDVFSTLECKFLCREDRKSVV